MDVLRDQEASARRATLSRILKLLRRRAGMRSSEVAREMGKALRSYQRFEAGEQDLDLAEIRRFARVVDADPWGIVFGVEFGSVDFAMHVAGNKGASWMLVALRRFDRLSGKDLAVLDPRTLSLVFARGFDQLSVKAQEYDADLEQWMFDGALDGSDEDPDQA
jgi:transcriptional regulator with XRE-family HTH domain